MLELTALEAWMSETCCEAAAKEVKTVKQGQQAF
jgi:hypothetical protein